MSAGIDEYGRRVAAVGYDEVMIQARHIRPGDVVLGKVDRYARSCRRGIVSSVGHHKPNDGSGRTVVSINYKFATLGEGFTPGENVVVRAPRHWTGQKVVFSRA